MKIVTTLAACVLLGMALSACSSDSEHPDEGSEGNATGSMCPPSSDLTYDSFGRDFMASYCTRCHSSTLSGAARNGAPADHNFDTLSGIVTMAEHIDENAAAGPAATNTTMPPAAPVPTHDERLLLGEWLACETAKEH
ncbi:MAG TPA: hypothetical protein VFK05_21105 [Polyangiaceae bacterium]|nr:hypothetical protein [Polyangiaceae bacterium]